MAKNDPVAAKVDEKPADVAAEAPVSAETTSEAPAAPEAVKDAPEAAPAAPDEAPAADVAAEAPEAAPTGEVDPAIADLNAGLIAMYHPDGGSCDLYGKGADGDILVPASEAASMIEHGFIVREAEG